MTNKHLKAFEAKKVDPGETLLASASVLGGALDPGATPSRVGALILTDRRVCFYQKRLFGETYQGLTVREDELRYAPTSEGGRVTGRFQSGGASLVFVSDAQGDAGDVGALLGKLRDLREAQNAIRDTGAELPAPPKEGVSVEYQLMRLGELRAMGMLSDLDFVVHKGRIISGEN
ncbi:MAG TPA: hypothetical protein VF631_10490 [Allosphingosinicella sp.]|jgi:hypothetical protein|uniref:hypothetical protein n=1 Tax=Allosphingosinicella sp. TaxID=2823234 RepID=UPI002F2A6D0B